MEEVFLAKGWKPPKKDSRRRTRSVSPPRSRQKSNYQGKKNGLGPNNKPKKCYICQCKHAEQCNCPCMYHLANTCPERINKKGDKSEGKTKPDLGLFVNSNINTYLVSEDDQVFIVKETLHNLVMLSVTHHEAVVD